MSGTFFSREEIQLKTLQCYVGVDNTFVMLEKFPEDEIHEGLNELLEDFIALDVLLIDLMEEIPVGLYDIDFMVRNSTDGSFLDIEDLRRVK